jgi:hypothetical protein
MRIYEITAATEPTEIKLLQRLSQRFGVEVATSLEDFNNKLERKIIDRCAVRVGLPPGSTVDQVLAAQARHVRANYPKLTLSPHHLEALQQLSTPVPAASRWALLTRIASIVLGVGAGLATYSGGLNTGEDEELARRRQLAPTVN